MLTDMQVLLFLLAVVVRAINKPAEYDSDDDIIGTARSTSIRQPLIHSQNVPATGVPVPTLDQRASRNDAWSQRMREKVHYSMSSWTVFNSIYHYHTLRCLHSLIIIFSSLQKKKNRYIFLLMQYGLDTSQFTYNPSDTGRYQQNGAPPAEERNRCAIL